MHIHNERLTAQMNGDFVVFLIGMRINSFWQINKWYPVVMAMPRMIRELYHKKEYGFLGGDFWFGRTTISLQYWESFEKLEQYARNSNAEHLPAWNAFNKAMQGTNAVGIWHETYIVKKGQYENIYNNMPKFGLGTVGALVPATGNYKNAKQRMSM